MDKKEVEQRYNELVNGIEEWNGYDGRGKGVDVYVCKKCGEKVYTRYKDKGVTPFTIGCQKCNETMVHELTISEVEAGVMSFKVQNWVRPTLEQTLKYNEEEREGLVEHILNGGLMLEEELEKENIDEGRGILIGVKCHDNGKMEYSITNMDYDDIVSLLNMIKSAKLPERRHWNQVKETIEENIIEYENH